MVEAYNFLASWQLFPEKAMYQHGTPARSGLLKIESGPGEKSLRFSEQRVSQDGQGTYSEFSVVPGEKAQPISAENTALSVFLLIENVSCLLLSFYQEHQETPYLSVKYEIMPNGYLKLTQQEYKHGQKTLVNTDVYHKQLSVLPYASSAGSVVVRPTEEGAIKHTALRAMEEQTNMQLDQIREQIELLARQAQELRRRRDLSLLIYEARLGFQPVIGQVYYLYEKRDSSHILSLVAPQEWGSSMPYQQFISAVKLLADHTWTEINQKAEKPSTATIVV